MPFLFVAISAQELAAGRRALHADPLRRRQRREEALSATDPYLTDTARPIIAMVGVMALVGAVVAAAAGRDRARQEPERIVGVVRCARVDLRLARLPLRIGPPRLGALGLTLAHDLTAVCGRL